ncbi:DotG/IcmE/VirB10 family protein [Inquilinus sp.]|jgi:intracellular multiplication protein IcmE|uniref:DotG/IcmE/VirB10 family protein n=1 Tax=Inquilinus sp. TaxID=1932117 RepID=UPI0037839B14
MALNPKHRVAIYVGIAVTVTVAAAGTIAIVSMQRGPVGSGLAGAQLNDDVPGLRNDYMRPVGEAEASRRASTNTDQVATAAAQGGTAIAQPVIAESYPAGSDLDETLRAAQPEAPPAPAPVPTSTLPPQQIIIYQQAPRATFPTEALSQYQERIRAQIALAEPTSRGFSVVSYPKPAPPAPATSSQAASPGASVPNASGAVTSRVVAQPGDIVYATLDQGFNSDDPQGLPVFATIRDPRDGGRGPLDGGRLMGKVTYSRENAALTFQTLIINGRTVPIQAMAISETDARSGIAGDVDFHTLERYGSLFVAGLIQGVGEVGQLLAENYDATVYPDVGAIQYSNRDVDWATAGMGVLRPLGNQLSGIAGRGFDRPPTITSLAGMGMGIIFTQPVSL